MTDHHHDHGRLLVACAEGDQGALQTLYQLEGACLLGVVQRIVHDRAVAEDIIHDAFVNIWTRSHTFDAGRGSGRTWMFSVARHLALNHVRRQGREVTVNDDHAERLEAERSLDAGTAMEDTFDWQGRGDLDRCLSALEPERRNCLFHAYVDGYSHSEIAERLDRPLGTVKAWIKRSLHTLRECLS
ncbi:sigma-70 family RNA polymerase sigma factor [Kushneria phyllosphaerae]|uniref:sigma-70 family RNA polymerase sigma factor n=1 Tax=Kushneria phyllosphaerae TaxID=2100822 RepID=UPI001FAF33C3|nr:sigma-70 family RNA polymerase sigma factor [Kushneria phyllosphaerae]